MELISGLTVPTMYHLIVGKFFILQGGEAVEAYWVVRY
jgi:hypothetical protein